MVRKKADVPRYRRDDLLKSKMFSHVQPDFLKAVLQRDTYTIEEAKKEIKRFFGKE